MNAESQGLEQTIEMRVQIWIQIAEKRSRETEGYILYPGDWASLADVLRRVLAVLGT